MSGLWNYPSQIQYLHSYGRQFVLYGTYSVDCQDC